MLLRCDRHLPTPRTITHALTRKAPLPPWPCQTSLTVLMLFPRDTLLIPKRSAHALSTVDPLATLYSTSHTLPSLSSPRLPKTLASPFLPFTIHIHLLPCPRQLFLSSNSQYLLPQCFTLHRKYWSQLLYPFWIPFYAQSFSPTIRIPRKISI